jgi:prevent-host-death family protein
MGSVAVRELNQQTSAVLARVSRGETIEVTANGRVVARLVPVAGDVSLLDSLVAEGRATRPTVLGKVPAPPTLGDPELSVADEVAAARDEERW